MLTILLIIVAAVLLTIGLVWVVDKFLPSKLKPVLIGILWVLIAIFGYQTYMSIYEPIKFNKLKDQRYADAIEKLTDIRDSQLAYNQITGKYAENFDQLTQFIDTAQFTLTQRRDTTVLDEEMTARYGGIEQYEEITIVDTLGYASVKDSLFKGSDRYRTMMNVPHAPQNETFEMQAGFIEEKDLKIPVFEAKVNKEVLLHDQDKDLLVQEKQVVSVDGVNGQYISVGSMEEVKTKGNWPKNYGDSE